MLAEERRTKVLELVNERGSISVNDLHRRLKVSRETIRRDITRLSEDGHLRKTHGGALALFHSEPIFDDRLTVNTDGKKAIGYAAAGLVTDDASLLIDSGTTTLWLAEALAERRRLTIYTNDIHIAGRLAGKNDNRVILTGGELIASEGAMIGHDTITTLANYFPDFAFVGATALSAHPWLMEYTREAAEMRAQMLAQARTKVLLADQTKFERTAPVRVSGLEEVDTIIVDAPPPPAMHRAFARLAADVIVAPPRD